MTNHDPLLAENNKCSTCNRELDNPADPLSADCGGHCVKCMADAGDPECMAQVAKVTTQS